MTAAGATQKKTGTTVGAAMPASSTPLAGANVRTSISIASRTRKVKVILPTTVIWLDDLIPLGLAHVESRSHPGTWHDVDCLRGRCDCIGFTMREKCAHVEAARSEWPAAILWRQRRLWAARRQEVLLQATYGDAVYVWEGQEAA